MPDAVYVKARVLGALVDLDGFTNPSGVPVSDVGDEMALVPVYAVFFLLRVFDDGGSIPVAASVVSLVFLESSIEVTAGFPDVDFAAVAGDLVDAWLFVGWVFILMRVKDGVELAGGLVSDEDVSRLEDAL